jgi:hypothetical protein
MQSSNLAERFDLEEPGTPATPAAPATPTPDRPAVDAARAPRPRRSLEFRAIRIRDQGFSPFRVS